MYSLNNSVRLTGNVGMNPEILTFDNGNQVAKVSLATSERRKDANGDFQELTTWHNLVIWGKRADVIQKYIQKGDKLSVEGRLSNREYTDKDGNKRYFTEIVVNDFNMLGGNKPANADVVENKTKQAKKEKADLPF